MVGTLSIIVSLFVAIRILEPTDGHIYFNISGDNELKETQDIEQDKYDIEQDIEQVDIPPGCRFHPRCPKAFEPCPIKEPELIDAGNDHFVACHLYSS